MRRQGLWATHLGPELGGQGYGQLKLALLNEILGRSQWAPIVFGCQAPDTGNAEIIAHYGTDGAEGALPAAAARRRAVLLLLDDRAARRRRPDACSRPARCSDGDEWVINGWKFFSSNAKTASFLIVMAVTNPDVSAYQGMSMFLVPTDTPGVNIVRNVGLYGERDERGLARAHPLRQRAGAGRRAARRRGPGVRDRADPPRRRAHPPRDAHHRPGAEGARHDVRAGAEPRDRRAACSPTSSSCRATSPTRTRSCMQFRLFVLYTAWEIDKYNDYKQVRKDIAAVKVVMPTVLHDIAWRAMQVHGALGVTNEMPFLGMITGAARDGPGRRPDRGAQDHRRQAGAARTTRPPTTCGRPSGLPRKRDAAQGQVRRVPRARGGEPVSDTQTRRRAPCRLDGRRRRCRARASRSRRASCPAARQNEIYELRRGDARCVLRMPPPGAPPGPRQGHPARVADHRGARRHRRAAHRRRSACARTPSVLGRPFYLMGFVDGWSPMDQHGEWPEPFDTDLERPAGAELPTGRGHRAAVEGRLAGKGAAGPRPSGRLPRAPGRPVDRLPRTHQGARAPRPRRGHRLAAGPPAARLHPRPHARRLPVRQRHVPARRAGAAGGDRRLGDGHRRRPEARPGLDGAVLARGHQRRRRRRDELRRHARHAVARRRCVAHYAEVSGRQVDDLDYYLVLAKWKLAIVLEQGFQRAGDDEKLLAFGPVVHRPDGARPPNWPSPPTTRG